MIPGITFVALNHVIQTSWHITDTIIIYADSFNLFASTATDYFASSLSSKQASKCSLNFLKNSI
jgi:hypothetical protein